jgi:hypothetical protein
VSASPSASRQMHSMAHTPGWRCDYCVCPCARNDDDCPHCGLASTDAVHRGVCHARSDH